MRVNTKEYNYPLQSKNNVKSKIYANNKNNTVQINENEFWNDCTAYDNK